MEPYFEFGKGIAMENQEELSNSELVTIAVYNLGGTINAIDLEDVAVYVFDLAPKRFSWKKYQDKIDLRIVQYSINDAIKKDIGYLNGNTKYGYMLTEAGLNWVVTTESNFLLTKSSRKLSTFDLVEKEIDRLQRSNATRKFTLGDIDQISIMDFREFTRVNDNFPKHLREQRFAKIQNVTDDDEILSQVWNFLKTKFIVKG